MLGMNVEQLWDQLTKRAATIADLMGVQRLLSWDQEVLMPAKSVDSRANQLATVSGLIHSHYTDRALGDLLSSLTEALPPFSKDELAAEGPIDGDGRPTAMLEAAVVRAMGRHHERQVHTPAELVTRAAQASTKAKIAWREARKNNAFAEFKPFLEEQFAIAKELAEHWGYTDDIYDPLLDEYEPGLTHAWITERFNALKPRLKELIAKVAAATDGDPSLLEPGRLMHRPAPAATQVAFGRRMAEAVGFDFNHGRFDLSTHPFTGGPAFNDVRLTTRVDERYFPSCLFASIHEAGHGIHGQKLHPALSRIPFRYGLALAESQSRFFENILGRSRAFWDHWYPSLQKAVPEFADVSIDSWYRGINHSQPSLIRVEADELTYGMHIMLRFGLEHAIVNGDLAVADLPGAWNDGMEDLLGIRPEDDANGVLQDIHWSMGAVGYFPDYLLGSMLSSQLWKAFAASDAGAEEAVRRGELGPVWEFLEKRVQTFGGAMTFSEVTAAACGEDFDAEPYVSYLTNKYSEIYRL